MKDVSAFERRYAREGDLWSFATSPYEQERYDTIADMVPERLDAVFEPGCATGELTARLARRSRLVVAVDASLTAVRMAAARCHDLPAAVFAVGAIPSFWPRRTFSAVVLSELGYYFDDDRWRDLVPRFVDLVAPGGALVACHWLGTSADHRSTGQLVHRRIAECGGLRSVATATVTDPAGAGCVIGRWCRR